MLFEYEELLTFVTIKLQIPPKVLSKSQNTKYFRMTYKHGKMTTTKKKNIFFLFAKSSLIVLGNRKALQLFFEKCHLAPEK